MRSYNFSLYYRALAVKDTGALDSRDGRERECHGRELKKTQKMAEVTGFHQNRNQIATKNMNGFKK